MRYLKTFDREGKHTMIQGTLLFTITCLLVYSIMARESYIIAGFVLVVGSEVAFKFINRAVIGSLYRQKDGKNQDLYQANKEYLDARFEQLGYTQPTKKNK